MNAPVPSTVPFPSSAEDPVPLIDLKPQYQNIKDEVDETVQRVFESQGFVLGEDVSNFEGEIADYCDSRHAIGLSLIHI